MNIKLLAAVAVAAATATDGFVLLLFLLPLPHAFNKICEFKLKNSKGKK